MFELYKLHNWRDEIIKLCFWQYSNQHSMCVCDFQVIIHAHAYGKKQLSMHTLLQLIRQCH